MCGALRRGTEPGCDRPHPRGLPLGMSAAALGITLADVGEHGIVPLPSFDEVERPRHRRPSAAFRIRRWATVALAVALPALLVVSELRTSRFQSLLLTWYAGGLDHSMAEGPAPEVRFPGPGPYDRRLGYSELPTVLPALADRGYGIAAQARPTRRLIEVVDRGVFPIYREKTQAGLTILDRRGTPIHSARFPERTLSSYESIPSVVVRSLLFLENRALLESRAPYLNPAVEWDRMAQAGARLAFRSLGRDGSVPGASTLATQIEKFRHSPDGVTRTTNEKLRQMASASLRAYRDGRATHEAQRRVVVDYLNSVPLGGIPGYGEVNGLGAGLWAWYGIDVTTLQVLFGGEAPAVGREQEAGEAFRAVLGLLIAHRRPTYYLGREAGRADLARRTEAHLDLLEAEGIVSPALAAAARSANPSVRSSAPRLPTPSFLDRKAANAIRRDLLDALGVRTMYELDRYDLTVRTTFDEPVQRAVTGELLRLREPDYVRSTGLTGPRFLEGADPSRVTYALTLYESTAEGSVVRVQTDNFDGPFDPNEAGKLELGSTAKLRTLVTYLETVEELYHAFSARSPEELTAPARFDDPLTLWVQSVIASRDGITLEEMLEEALERRYSASPSEPFYTGGGRHTFANFDDTFDHRAVGVREAFRHSVNLVFIRMMRDVVRYHSARLVDARGGIDAARGAYLARFADQEGRTFLRRFYATHATRSHEERMTRLVAAGRAEPTRLARLQRAVAPESDSAAIVAFVASTAAPGTLTPARLRTALARTAPPLPGLVDAGYLVGVHPLELWLVRHLRTHPGATLGQVLEASVAERQEAYAWLFRTRRREAQDLRIATLVEAEAFASIHGTWRRLGFPFGTMVPSLASAIGSSGDRPAALAELMGIIVNDGTRHARSRIEELHFAEGTPYETVLVREPDAGSRVMSVAVARAARGALVDVVEHGTARRLAGAFTTSDGRTLTVGAKTGTGDNRHEVTGAGGRVIQSRPTSRTATLVFFIGDRHFGVLTAYVEGPEADRYRFTSGLPAEVLRQLAPILQPLLEGTAPTS